MLTALNNSILIDKKGVVFMKKHSMRFIFVSLMLIMQSIMWVGTAEAGESVQDKVQSMEPVIKTYANCRGSDAV